MPVCANAASVGVEESLHQLKLAPVYAKHGNRVLQDPAADKETANNENGRVHADAQTAAVRVVIRIRPHIAREGAPGEKNNALQQINDTSVRTCTESQCLLSSK